MSDTTARTIRMVKAQGILEAGEKLLNHCYSPPQTEFERAYNFATRDAVSRLRDLAFELEHK